MQVEFTLANQVTEFQLRFSAPKNSQNRDDIYATYSKLHYPFCAVFLQILSGFFIRSEAPDIYFGKLEVTLAIDHFFQTLAYFSLTWLMTIITET